MTTYLWEKNDGGGWVPFDGTPTAANPSEDFDEGTWSVRLTADGVTKTRNDYVAVTAAPSYIGPLDLVPGALVAYSLRALSSAWLGQNVARLRRSSDNAELDFAADVVTGDFPSAAAIAWRDAVGAADAFVVTRYDQSGNGKNETQATAIRQPLWVPSATNGKPVIDYNHDGAFRRISTSADVDYTDSLTTIFVGKFDDAARSSNMCGFRDGGGDHGFQVSNNVSDQSGEGSAFLGSFIFASGGGEMAICGTTVSHEATIGAYFVVGMTVSGSEDGKVRLNGTLQTVANSRTSVTPFSEVFTSGDANPSAVAEMDGTEAESLLYGSVLSDANILSINQEQMTYYGIS